MALNKIRRLDETSLGITLPKDDLRIDGFLDKEGGLNSELSAHVRREGPGRWTVEILENL